jgi:hypothetical protein
MISKKLVVELFTVFFIVISAIYVFQLSDLVGNILYLIPPFLAFIAGLYAVRTYRLSNGHGQVMGLLTAGMLCWLIGEILFFYFQFISHNTPFPSIADAFYLVGYPLIFAGLTKEILIHKVDLKNFNKLYLTLVIMLVIVLIVIVSYFGVYKAYDQTQTFLSNAISIAYGIGDLILIVPGLFILKIALDYAGGKLYNSWVLILLGLIATLGGDILFAIFRKSYTKLVWPYTLIDLFYIISYLLFSYSFFYTATTIRSLHAKLVK